MKFTYKTVTGTVEIEVDEKWGIMLEDLDRKEESAARRQRHHCVRIDFAMDHEPWLGSVENDPQEAYSETEMESRLRQALAELTPEQRRLAEKIFYEELTQKEIAGEENVTQGAISKRKKILMKDLRRLMG